MTIVDVMFWTFVLCVMAGVWWWGYRHGYKVGTEDAAHRIAGYIKKKTLS